MTYTKDKEGRVIAAHSHEPVKPVRLRRRVITKPAKRTQTPLEAIQSLFA